MGQIKLWVCMNRVMGWRIAFANNAGIRHNEYFFALWETNGSWPNASNNLFMKIQGMHIMGQMAMRLIMALFVCIPSFWYCCAPNACPHNVSNPPANPDWFPRTKCNQVINIIKTLETIKIHQRYQVIYTRWFMK